MSRIGGFCKPHNEFYTEACRWCEPEPVKPITGCAVGAHVYVRLANSGLNTGMRGCGVCGLIEPIVAAPAETPKCWCKATLHTNEAYVIEHRTDSPCLMRPVIKPLGLNMILPSGFPSWPGIKTNWTAEQMASALMDDVLPLADWMKEPK